MLKIAENIKRYRKKYGFTQEYLATQLNVSTTAVCKWESGTSNPDITLLIPMAQIFNISVDELMGFDKVKMEVDIDRVLDEYSKLNLNGQKLQAKALIIESKKNFRQIIEYSMNICGTL